MKTPFDTLAEHVATKAIEKDTPFAEAIDALKAVTAYLTMANKKGSEPPEPGDEPSFANFRQDMARTEERADGTTTLRGRRRRTGHEPN